MSMKMFRLSSLLFASALVVAAVCFDLPAVAGNTSAQNSNSATTTMTGNSNMGTTRKTQGRRKQPPATPTAESTVTPATDVAAATTPAEATVQTDLSGTYAGTFDCSDAGVTGDTTLTITGNQFTTADGKSGRITAATTRGYTGVAMQFGELTSATSAQPSVSPVIVSMRAKKSGDRLTLSSVQGATHACSFMPAASSRSARARRTRTKATTPTEVAPTAEPVAAPVTPAEPVTTPAVPAEPMSPSTPSAEAGPMPPAAPKPGRRGRKTKPAPAPAPEPAPVPPPN